MSQGLGEFIFKYKYYPLFGFLIIYYLLRITYVRNYKVPYTRLFVH